MTDVQFGAVLAEARRRNRLTVSEVSHRLHVRRDIIEAIERSDFDAMPPRTYARTMVVNYADLLGLDSRYLADLYTDAYNERKKAREHSLSDSLRSAYESPRSHRSPSEEPEDSLAARRSASRPASADRRARAGAEPSAATARLRGFSGDASFADYADSAYPRTDEPAPLSSRRSSFETRRGANAFRVNANDIELTEEDLNPLTHGTKGQRSSSGGGGRNRTRTAVADGVADEAGGEYTDPRLSDGHRHSGSTARWRGESGPSSRRGRGSADDRPYTYSTNFYTGSIPANRARAFSIRPAYLIVAAIVIVLVIVIAVVVTGRSKGDAATQASTVPITGLTDTDASAAGSTSSIVAPVEPTSVEFAYSVNDGVETYIEIYLDDSETAELANVVTGPSKGSYDVSGTLTFTCTQPDGVSLTVDGESVSLTANEDTSWIYEYKVDFSSYLASWKEKYADQIAAAEKAKADLLASQSSSSPSASASGVSSSSAVQSSSGRTTTN